MSIKNYESPKLYNTCESILNKLYQNHRKINKTIRIITLEKEVYPKLIESLKNILNISFNKKELDKNEIIVGFDALFFDSRIIQSHLSFLLNANYIKMSFYKEVSILLESYQRQLQGWKSFILENNKFKQGGLSD